MDRVDSKMTFNEKKSKLPKWLLDRGINDNHGITLTRKDIQDYMNRFIKKSQRKNATEKSKKYNLAMAKYSKRDLKDFKIDYFLAEDVEEFFRQILDKYELFDKEKTLILRPNPKDIGKKRYYCEKCNKQFFVKDKPKQCSKCKSKNIQRYYRL